jgi:hypothetical protein
MDLLMLLNVKNVHHILPTKHVDLALIISFQTQPEHADPVNLPSQQVVAFALIISLTALLVSNAHK